MKTTEELNAIKEEAIRESGFDYDDVKRATDEIVNSKIRFRYFIEKR